MKKLGLIALLGTAILAGCATNKAVITDYPFEKSIVNEMDFFQEDSNLKVMLAQGLDNVKASGIFNPKFMKKLDNLVFVIESGRNFDYGGFYRKEGNQSKILVALDEEHLDKLRKEYPFAGGKEELDRTMKAYTSFEILETLVHEIAHYYWFNEMSEEDKKEFRQEVLKDIEKMKSSLSSHTSPTLDMGEIPPFYKNLNEFLSHEEYYKKRYGANFDELFYGTEAYSSLMCNEMIMKAISKENAEKNKGTANFEKMMKESSYRNSSDFKEITPELKEFYKGCIDDYFFQKFIPSVTAE